ncbi:MAG: hypothetical protein KAR35_00700 [Candidatus Heimdallarchaeota archaeon]|nr:hypothetical protein [Candidatus Heimdallarchaeota archaeon]MCK5047871.1 hypothetical protein [Candidatus Heimdallarchaeota archaeon]
MSKFKFSEEDILKGALKEATSGYFRKRSFMDSLWITSMFMWLFSFLVFRNANDLIYYSFLLGMVALLWLMRTLSSLYEDINASVFSTVLLMAFLNMIVSWMLKFNDSTEATINDYTYSFEELKQWFYALLVMVWLIAGSLHMEFLKGEKRSYYNFLIFTLRGAWRIGVIIIILFHFDIIIGHTDSDALIKLEAEMVELVLLGGLALNVTLAYFVPEQKAGAAGFSNIFAFSETQSARAKNALMNGLMVIILLKMFNWLEADFWGAILLLLIFYLLFTFFYGAKMEGPGGMEFPSVGGISSKHFSTIPEKLKNLNIETFADQAKRVEEPVEFKSKQGSFKVSQNAVLMPLIEREEQLLLEQAKDVTEDEVEEVTVEEYIPLLVVGDGEAEIETEGNLQQTQIDGMTVISVLKSEWEKWSKQYPSLKKLDKINFQSLGGFNSLDDVLNNVHVLGGQMSKIRDNFVTLTQSMSTLGQGYGITERHGFTSVRLPGLRVLDTKDYDIVKLPGISVFDSKKFTIVNLSFIGLKVVEVGNYTYVSLPGLTVFDGPKSTEVRILGFRVSEGDPIDLDKIEQEMSKKLKQMDLVMDRLLDNPDAAAFFSLDREGSFKLGSVDKGKLLLESKDVSKDLARTTRASSKRVRGDHRVRRHERPSRGTGVKGASRVKRVGSQRTKTRREASPKKETVQPPKEVPAREKTAIDVEFQVLKPKETLTTPTYAEESEETIPEISSEERLERMTKICKLYNTIEIVTLTKQLGFKDRDDLEEWLLDNAENFPISIDKDTIIIKE